MSDEKTHFRPRQAVILAGGLGTRLRPFTQILPKPMLPVGDRSILEIQISHLKKHEVHEIFFAANYKADMLKSYFGDGSKFGVKLFYSIEDKPLGTCGPLSLLVERLNEPFVVMNGDILTNIDLGKAYSFHLKQGGIFTVVSKMVTFPLSYGNLITNNNRIVAIHEKPDIQLEISTGIYLMNPEIQDFIPRNQTYGMDNLIQDLMARKIPIFCYRMADYWMDIGRMEDYEQAQKDITSIFKE